MADGFSMQGAADKDNLSSVRQLDIHEKVQDHEHNVLISDKATGFNKLEEHGAMVIYVKEPELHDKYKDRKNNTVISTKKIDANQKVLELELGRDHNTILLDEAAPKEIADDISTRGISYKSSVISAKEPDVREKVQEHKEDLVVSVKERDVHDKVESRIPHIGMVFKSVEEAFEFYNEYAQREGFSVKIRHSRYGEDGQCQHMILACYREGKGRHRSTNPCLMRPSKRTNCNARIKVRVWDDGLFHLVVVCLEHNHEVNPSKAPICRPSKRFKGLGVQPSKPCQTLAIHAIDHENSPSDLKENSNVLQSGMRLKLEKGDAEALHQYFNHMQIKNPNFFYLMDLDEGGSLKNVFWADGRSRAAYQYFGDVISFDTTCLTGKYDIPLVLFLGVNHHGQSVLLGCGILSNDSFDTFIWLFKAWMSCMSGRPPNAIITDQCKVIERAVFEVFPRAHHRYCLWRVMKNFPEKLSGHAEYKAIKRSLKNAVYDSIRVNEFEENWSKILENYGLKDDEWLNSLYESRHCWIPVFLQATFWAGMSTAERGGSLNFFFDDYVHSKTSLKQFLSKYEVALQSKYKKEAQADFDSFHKTPQLISQLYMEEQLCKIYTTNMFKRFQDEVKALICCHPSLVKVDGSVSTFEVKERVRMKDADKTENRNYEVLFNANGHEVWCICNSFHSRGILCRHALSVLNFQDVSEIPFQYIIERWRKDFKRVHALALSSSDVGVNGPSERYDNLYKCCLEFMEAGSISVDKYLLAMRILHEGKEKLLVDDSVLNDTLHGTMPCEATASEVNLRRKEPLTDKYISTNKKKGSRRTQRNGNQIDVFPTAPSTPYYGSHVGMQENISSMEQVDAMNLPVNAQFGVEMNHQHATGSQLRMPWNFQHMLQTSPGPRPQ